MSAPTAPNVVMLPETTYKLRAPFYRDVEALVFPGFLTHPVKVNGIPFSLRSLAQGDLFLLNARTKGQGDRGWRLWVVASSIWMFEGVCVLDQPSRVTWFYQYLTKMHPRALGALVVAVLGLFKRQGNALDTLESYCYEDVTRNLWRGYHKRHPAEHTGINGIQHVGSNYIQRQWIAFNQLEDERLTEKKQWEGFKLVASTMAHKWVKSINEQETAAWQKELMRRQAARDVWYYQHIGFLDKEEHREAAPDLYKDNKTPDDLSEEMRKWVSGESDVHDEIITNYKNSITRLKEQREASRVEYHAALEVNAAKLYDEGHQDTMVAYTPEQLHSIVKGRSAGRLSGARFIADGAEAHQHNLHDRYMAEKPSAGLLKVDGSGKIKAPGQVDLAGGDVAFHSEKGARQPSQSLNEKVSGRLVQFYSASEE